MASEQIDEITILRQNDGIRLSSIEEDIEVELERKPLRQRRSVRQSKRSPGDKNRVVDLTSRILETSLQVLWFQVRQILKDFRPSQSSGKEIEHVRNANAHAADARSAPALLGVCGDSRCQIRHHLSVPPCWISSFTFAVFRCLFDILRCLVH